MKVMTKLLSKTRTRRFYEFAMRCLVKKLDKADMGAPAIVFAPHPDDETLGCGGTIIKKTGWGADVRIVYMTDGSRTTHNLIPPNELRLIRQNEALAASRLLGVKEGRVIFLGFENRRLVKDVNPAIDRVAEILVEQPFQEVFVPYRNDKCPYMDHVAANRIVVSALRKLGAKTKVYEYPVWFWRRFWPWAGSLPRSPRKRLGFLAKSFASGWSLLKDFRYSVYIGDVLDLKHAALDQHRSQMTRLVPDLRWPTLVDVQDGQFLECFFREYELFRRYDLSC